jgi:hypothetical protein
VWQEVECARLDENIPPPSQLQTTAPGAYKPEVFTLLRWVKKREFSFWLETVLKRLFFLAFFAYNLALFNRQYEQVLLFCVIEQYFCVICLLIFFCYYN